MLGSAATMNSFVFEIGVLLLMAIVVGGWLFLRAGTISGARAREMVHGGALLVDVRTNAEFASGHIEGAVNIPVSELETRLPELGAKQGSIVLYCRSGARSALALRFLESQGYTTVANLGAMTSWAP